MKHSTVVSGIALSAGLIFLAAAQPLTAHDDDHDGHGKNSRINIKLNGFNENVPPGLVALSTPAKGEFKAKINRRGEPSIDYELSYEGFVGNNQPTQAHIHFGQRWQNGGISVWLCANNPPITNAPAGTQVCPSAPATIKGTIVAANVVGPAGQGIAPGEFNELLDAIDKGVTYANVHTPAFPGGEIRAQLKVR
jgi:hypothetical protein